MGNRLTSTRKEALAYWRSVDGIRLPLGVGPDVGGVVPDFIGPGSGDLLFEPVEGMESPDLTMTSEEIEEARHMAREMLASFGLASEKGE